MYIEDTYWDFAMQSNHFTRAWFNLSCYISQTLCFYSSLTKMHVNGLRESQEPGLAGLPTFHFSGHTKHLCSWLIYLYFSLWMVCFYIESDTSLPFILRDNSNRAFVSFSVIKGELNDAMTDITGCLTGTFIHLLLFSGNVGNPSLSVMRIINDLRCISFSHTFYTAWAYISSHFQRSEDIICGGLRCCYTQINNGTRTS